MITFDKIVHKLWLKKSSILLIDDLVELIDPENTRAKTGMREVYKTVYRLKSEGIIFALRNGLFLIGVPETKKDTVALIEQYYWEIALAFIRREVNSDYIIGGPKALELHIGDMSTPSVLVVYAKATKKSLKISPRHTIIFKTIEAGKRVSGNLYPKLTKHTVRIEIVGGHKIRILSQEAALLDALIVHIGGQYPDRYLLKKFLDRYASVLDRGILGKLVEMRYISSINRLREAAKEWGYEGLYRDTVDIIRMEGAGCFLTMKP